VFLPVLEYLRTQGYQIKLVNNYEDLLKKMHQFHIVILSGVVSDHENQIIEIISKKTDPYFSEKTSTPQPHRDDTDNADDLNTQGISARLLIFGSGEIVSKFNLKPGIIASRPSVDLRTIDIAIRCLLFDFQTNQLLNTKGTLNLKKAAASINMSYEKQKILIGHFRSDVRGKFRNYFAQKNKYDIEEANEGPKLVNLAKTSTGEIHLIILDLNIPLMECMKVVKAIKTLPFHRRARFVILVKNAQKEQLLPLVKLGVRDFLSEESTVEEFGKKFGEIGF
jgi:CheY-like chemotaxis protein